MTYIAKTFLENQGLTYIFVALVWFSGMIVYFANIYIYQENNTEKILGNDKILLIHRKISESWLIFKKVYLIFLVLLLTFSIYILSFTCLNNKIYLAYDPDYELLIDDCMALIGASQLYEEIDKLVNFKFEQKISKISFICNLFGLFLILMIFVFLPRNS